MLPLLLILALGTLGYLWWQWRSTTLTRNCRWRQDKRRGNWFCAFCGGRAVTADGKPPRHCARPGA